MNKIMVLILGVGMVCFLSCDKNKLEDIGTQEDYYPLSVGNYWVYESYTRNANQTEFHLMINSRDSTYIDKDTIIDNLIYYKRLSARESGALVIDYIRYEKDELVNSLGHKLFSANPSFAPPSLDTSVINTGNYYETIPSLGLTEELVTVNSGIFTCADWAFSNKWVHSDTIIQQSQAHYYYAKGVGFVQMAAEPTLSIHSYTQKNLEAYHIN